MRWAWGEKVVRGKRHRRGVGDQYRREESPRAELAGGFHCLQVGPDKFYVGQEELVDVDEGLRGADEPPVVSDRFIHAPRMGKPRCTPRLNPCSG